jgi:hypothetical protein
MSINDKSLSTRRQFVGNGLVVSAFSLGSVNGIAGSVEMAGISPITKAVFDSGFVVSRVLAAAASRRGIPTHVIAGDVTNLWYDELDKQWRTEPGWLAGMTGVSALFCLEQLGRRADRRVVLRIEHIPVAAGYIEHRLRGTVRLARVDSVLTKSTAWPLELADAMFTGAVDARGGRQVRSLRGPAGPIDNWEEPMVTWLIAPRSMA